MSQCLKFDGNFGNPASRSHVFGWRAEEAVEEARAQMADLLNCDPREIVWTSGATESDNLAIKGAVEPFPDGHIITSQIEHKAVLDTCAWLERRGYEVTYLAPTAAGWVDPEDVRQALRGDTRIVSIMHSNNEIGVLNDIRAIGDVVQRHGALFHVDAAQTVGKIPVDLADLPVDLLSVSAHKFYGPKGIGVLYVRRAIAPRVLAQIHGGGHERGMRSGTLATHQIVGIGAAAHLAGEHLEQEGARIRLLRDRLWRHLAQMPGVRANGDLEQRVPGNLNVGFEGVDGEALLQALDDIAVSSGSACTSATVEPSYVLKALGLPDDVAHASLRITVGRYTSAADVDVAAARIQEVVARLREFEASRSQ